MTVDLAEYVREIVDRAPPLTDDQRARLAALVHDVGERDAA